MTLIKEGFSRLTQNRIHIRELKALHIFGRLGVSVFDIL